MKNYLFFLLFLTQTTQAAGAGQARSSSGSNLASNPNGLNTQYLQLKIENQELELHRLFQRLDNQDASLEAIRKEMLSLKEKNNSKELSSVNQRIDQMMNDLKNLHLFLEKTDKELIKQNHALHEMHEALGSVLEAFQDPIKEAKDSLDVYIVQSGDTLGGIAIKNHTTIKKIKEWNEMSKDTVYVGQKLRLKK